MLWHIICIERNDGLAIGHHVAADRPRHPSATSHRVHARARLRVQGPHYPSKNSWPAGSQALGAYAGSLRLSCRCSDDLGRPADTARIKPCLLEQREELALRGHVRAVQVVAAHLVLVLQQHLAVRQPLRVPYVAEVRRALRAGSAFSGALLTPHKRRRSACMDTGLFGCCEYQRLPSWSQGLMTGA